jgi:WD40 repeat protein
VHLVDPSDGRTVRDWEAHKGMVGALRFLPDGRLLSGGQDGAIRSWEAADGAEAGALEGHAKTVMDLSVSKDGAMLASAGADGTVRLWDLASREALAVLAGHEGVVYAVALHPSGRWLVSGGKDRTLRLWSVEDRSPVQTVEVPTTLYSLTWHPEGALLAASGEAGEVHLLRFREPSAAPPAPPALPPR